MIKRYPPKVKHQALITLKEKLKYQELMTRVFQTISFLSSKLICSHLLGIQKLLIPARVIEKSLKGHILLMNNNKHSYKQL